MRVSLPRDLRSARLPDLPPNITLAPGRLEVNASTAVSMLESLVALAMVMQNDLEKFREVIEPPDRTSVRDVSLTELVGRMREGRQPIPSKRN